MQWQRNWIIMLQYCFRFVSLLMLIKQVCAKTTARPRIWSVDEIKNKKKRRKTILSSVRGWVRDWNYDEWNIISNGIMWDRAKSWAALCLCWRDWNAHTAEIRLKLDMQWWQLGWSCSKWWSSDNAMLQSTEKYFHFANINTISTAEVG